MISEWANIVTFHPKTVSDTNENLQFAVQSETTSTPRALSKFHGFTPTTLKAFNSSLKMTSVLRQSILTVYYLMIAKDKDLSCFQMITAGRRVDYFHLLDPQ